MICDVETASGGNTRLRTSTWGMKNQTDASRAQRRKLGQSRGEIDRRVEADARASLADVGQAVPHVALARRSVLDLGP